MPVLFYFPSDGGLSGGVSVRQAMSGARCAVTREPNFSVKPARDMTFDWAKAEDMPFSG